MLSLLGILGYVRALVKLGLGPKKCEKAGFDMKALRPMVGVADTDRLPADEIYVMHYIERHENGSEIQWIRGPETKHTVDSSALGFYLDYLSRASKSEITKFEITNFYLDRDHWQPLNLGDKLFKSRLGDVFVLLVSLICVGLTSLLVVPLRATSGPTWSFYFATVGILAPIFCSSILWAWVFAQEQLPYTALDSEKRPSGNISFAYLRSGKRYLTLNVRAIGGEARYALRAMSLFAAFSALVG